MTTFEFDLNKEASNIEKHGISFSEAQETFLSDDFYTLPSQNNTSGEDRYLGIGTASSLGRVILVVYTHRTLNIRIISARAAHDKELERYENLKQNFPKR